MTTYYQVVRTHRVHKEITWDVATEKSARQLIFWCGIDNLSMTRKDAARRADAAKIGEPYDLDGYVFTITKASR